jgi:lipopolysaccharide biosynthesis regulator YciM
MIFGLFMLFVWVATIVGWIIYNLYQKNIKLENTVINQATFIAGVQSLIVQSDKALKDLDDKIWMESDKELQTVFESLKTIQSALNTFKN